MLDWLRKYNNKIGFIQIIIISFAVSFLFHVFSAKALASLPVYSPKVLLFVYDPVIESHGNKKLTQVKNWYNPTDLTNSIISNISLSSGNTVNYTVVQRIDLDQYPVKADGFQYTDQTYLDCANSNGANCHNPDGANYLAILNSVDACGKLNRGEIDEVWMWGGPWFGYWESNLAGPGAYDYNSPATLGSTCQKLLPIMGFNYERTYDLGLHNFGHRMEATMTHMYGSWSQNRMLHSWDKFALNKTQSPDFSASGCGSIHYPPNGRSPYDYGYTGYTNSYCNSFDNYPNLPQDLMFVSVPINCSAWGCTQAGYLNWWFGHLPKFEGTGPDGRLNNWWTYFADLSTTVSQPGTFSNFSANLTGQQAVFNFNYSGFSPSYVIDLSSQPLADIYLTFGQSTNSPIEVINPTQKWDKYTCGRTLYWRVYTSDRMFSSPVQTTVVNCSGLLQNGNFETSDSWIIPSWYSNNLTIDGTLPYQGSSSLRFHDNSSNAYAYQDLEITAGKTISLSGWVNVLAGGSGMSVKVEIQPYNVNNGQIGNPIIISNSTMPTQGWALFSGQAVMPSNTVRVRLIVKSDAPRITAYFDNFILTSD